MLPGQADEFFRNDEQAFIPREVSLDARQGLDEQRLVVEDSKELFRTSRLT
jgi:hypothetical protein